MDTELLLKFGFVLQENPTRHFTARYAYQIPGTNDTFYLGVRDGLFYLLEDSPEALSTTRFTSDYRDVILSLLRYTVAVGRDQHRKETWKALGIPERLLNL